MGNTGTIMRKNNPDIDRLCKALEWGLDTDRPAWKRALARAELDRDSYPPQLLNAVRQELLERAPSLISEWYEEIVAGGGAVDEISTFDGNPEGLWQELYYMNYGIFGLGPDPLDGFLVSVPSLKEGEMPLLLTPRVDGWGLPEEEKH
jgi:hypothetical protein